MINEHCKPKVIVIGASKCGTTSLHYYLSHHPKIFLSSKKELHFHSREGLMLNSGGPADKYKIRELCKDIKTYLRYYADASSDQICMDISPSYLFFPEYSINSIKNVCGPDTKIICIVRHPVDKIISQYTHLYFSGSETLDFANALENESKRKALGYSDMWLYRESGLMSDKIRQFKNSFKSTLVLNLSDFSIDLDKTLNIIFDFIGVDCKEMKEYNPAVKNFNGLPKSKLITKIFIEPNFFTYLLRRVIPQKIGKSVREWINNKNKGKRVEIDENLYKHLEYEFKNEISTLNELIDTKTTIGFKYLN